MIYIEGALRLRATVSIVGIATKITMNKRIKSNSIRLIAGQWRGRKLPVLDSPGLRPTTDRVRETLFNWLMHQCNGARVLDLFAGSGALGLECLSRGAAFVDFVENAKPAARQIQTNLDTLGASDKAQVWAMTADKFMHQRENAFANAYDLVFLDPPFADELLADTIHYLEAPSVLAQHAYIYIEFASGRELQHIPMNWELYRQGKAGQSQYHLYLLA